MFTATALATRRWFPVDPIYVADYETLRGIVTGSMLCFVTGLFSEVSTLEEVGWFLRDDNDTTSPDDGYNVIVASNGKRWKRIQLDQDDIPVLQATRFGVTADGVTNDQPALKRAFDALPEGWILQLPPGTMYLGTQTLDWRGKNNIWIRGAGMGSSILNGTDFAGAAYPLDSVLNVGGIPASANNNNQRFSDFSIVGNSPLGATNLNHTIGFRKCNNIRFERLEFSYGGREVLYCDGATPGFKGLYVHDCYFHDNFAQLCSCVNTNTGLELVDTIEIVNNRFETSTTGMYILGKNIRITGNSFDRMIETCINVGESNGNATQTLDSCVIANNTCEGLGTRYPGGPYLPAVIRGINSNARSFAYVNNGADNGYIVANNSFKNMAAPAGSSTRVIQMACGCIIDGNYASGKLSTGTVIFIDVDFSSDVNSNVGVNATPVKVAVRNNILEKKPAGNNIDFGVFVLSVDNAAVDFSGNRIDAVTTGAGFDSASNGFLPTVTVDGDIFMPTFRLFDLAGTDFGYGANPVPLYGSNKGGTISAFNNADKDAVTGGAFRNLGGGVATPDVSKGIWFHCSNAAPTNITNFINAPSWVNEITIWFNDANTTLVHNAALIRLRGAVNYVSAVGSCITLCRPNHINTAWVEKSRQ